MAEDSRLDVLTIVPAMILAMAPCIQIPLGTADRIRAIRSSRHNLAKLFRSHVPRHKNSRHTRLTRLPGTHIAMIRLNQIFHERTVRLNSDCHEDPVHRKLRMFPTLHIAKLNVLNSLLPADLLDHGIPENRHIRKRQKLFLKGSRPAQFSSAMNQIDVTAHPGQKNRILDRDIPASDDSDLFSAEKRSITRRTVAYTGTAKTLLAGNSKTSVCRP